VLVVEAAERVGVPVVVLPAHAGVHHAPGGIRVANVRGLYRPLAAAQVGRLAGLAPEVGQEAGITLSATVGLGGPRAGLPRLLPDTSADRVRLGQLPAFVAGELPHATRPAARASARSVCQVRRMVSALSRSSRAR